MEPRLSLVTLHVRDLPKMRAFYEECFGWRPITANDSIVFFQLNGLLFSLYAAPGAGETTPPAHPPFALAYNVRTSEEVDALFADFREKGVTIAQAPARTPYGGYAGLIADPEGNVWDIAANPFITFDASGNVIGHAPIEHLR